MAENSTHGILDIFDMQIQIYHSLDISDWFAMKILSIDAFTSLDKEKLERLYNDVALSRIKTIPKFRMINNFVDVVNIAQVLECCVEILQKFNDDAMKQAGNVHFRVIDTLSTPQGAVLSKLHDWALADSNLQARERSGRKSSIEKKLLRVFCSLNRVVPVLVDSHHPWIPAAHHVMICEILASIVHNSKEGKSLFVQRGGLSRLLGFIRSHSSPTNPAHVKVLESGLALLLALSSRSVQCIQIMVSPGLQSEQIVLAALEQHPNNLKIKCRAIGILANISNVNRLVEWLRRTTNIVAIITELIEEERRLDAKEAQFEHEIILAQEALRAHDSADNSQLVKKKSEEFKDWKKHHPKEGKNARMDAQWVSFAQYLMTNIGSHGVQALPVD